MPYSPRCIYRALSHEILLAECISLRLPPDFTIEFWLVHSVTPCCPNSVAVTVSGQLRSSTGLCLKS